jgi:SOS response associated peptidase (SRAP)
MSGRNESESFGYGSATRTPMDRQGRPDEPQLVYRRDPETGRPVEGLLRWGLIPHFCEKRPDFAPIHARAETVAEKEWFRDAYRRRRCVVRRCEARRLMAVLVKLDTAMRADARARREDELRASLRCDQHFRLAMRNFERPCEWTLDECWAILAEGAAQ